jgi:hypothetical protein
MLKVYSLTMRSRSNRFLQKKTTDTESVVAAQTYYAGYLCFNDNIGDNY